MKYYNKIFLKSELFYTEFYLTWNTLTEYIIKINLDRGLGEHEEVTKIVKREYIMHCESYFKKDIIFYKELSKYILNHNGSFKPLDEYIFLSYVIMELNF